MPPACLQAASTCHIDRVAGETRRGEVMERGAERATSGCGVEPRQGSRVATDSSPLPSSSPAALLQQESRQHALHRRHQQTRDGHGPRLPAYAPRTLLRPSPVRCGGKDDVHGERDSALQPSISIHRHPTAGLPACLPNLHAECDRMTSSALSSALQQVTTASDRLARPPVGHHSGHRQPRLPHSAAQLLVMLLLLPPFSP